MTTTTDTKAEVHTCGLLFNGGSAACAPCGIEAKAPDASWPMVWECGCVGCEECGHQGCVTA